jgi:hypothetical protein
VGEDLGAVGEESFDDRDRGRSAKVIGIRLEGKTENRDPRVADPDRLLADHRHGRLALAFVDRQDGLQDGRVAAMV